MENINVFLIPEIIKYYVALDTASSCKLKTKNGADKITMQSSKNRTMALIQLYQFVVLRQSSFDFIVI